MANRLYTMNIQLMRQLERKKGCVEKNIHKPIHNKQAMKFVQLLGRVLFLYKGKKRRIKNVKK